ncbi:amidohydrolase family protein [Rhodoplanes sp. TEM]|uniref:Amidohydrolase family protein n=1 Tax=Rhodoplanes tepidamans TaxID=200616 RepID=A0ABT5JBB6_RHOTP|nr:MULTISPECIES: amidohydrolase family protein [Rhodoplanes]MDC7786772.1 amidohydrolase family protein [Rhodoplanes tepidamans]MDC7987462.1 amidohydrolase family protein [Rhodoplanes sp. TEM]MDQ0356327.1 guanine deaminase [Rhodoplanes tepidamans]
MTDKTTLLIENGRALLPGGDPHQGERCDILVENGAIEEIGTGLAARLAKDGIAVETLDATDRLIIPGFVNAHYHSHDTLAKGTMDETPLETWRLLALPPQYPKRSREEIRARTLIGALECLRSGMTTVQDMVTLYPFDPEHFEAVVEAYEEIGVRAVVALQYADIRGIETIPFWKEVFPAEYHPYLSTAAEPDKKIDQLAWFEENVLKHPKPGARVSWALGPSAPERCSRALIERTATLARTYGLPIFTHIYESKGMALQARLEYPEHGGSLIRRLEQEGLLGPRLNLAHSVWLLPDEIEILARTGTNVVINPLSNAKLKSGIPPIRALQDAGVSLALGCDNCSCSDAQNMFQAMKLFALMVHISDPDPGPDQAGRAFGAATAGGAHAIGRDDLGQIAPGARADLVLIDLKDPSYVPLNSATRQLVYTEGGRGVDTVLVDGRVVIRHGRLATMDQDALLDEVMAVVPKFREDFSVIAARVETLKPWIAEAHKRIWAADVGTNRLFTGR